MGLGLNHFSLVVKTGKSLDGFSDDGLLTSNVMVFIYNAGTKTLATLYQDSGAVASLVNPITRASFNGKIDFWGANGTFDIVLNDDRGNFARHTVSPTDHTMKIDTTNVEKHFIAPFASVVGANVETDTGCVFPYNCIIEDVIVEVAAIQSAQTINVGLLSTQSGGVASGLLEAAPVSVLGHVQNEGVTVGSAETYLSTMLYGSLLGKGKVGTNVSHDQGVNGNFVKYKVTSAATALAQNLSYTLTTGATSAAGYIHAYFKHLR